MFAVYFFIFLPVLIMTFGSSHADGLMSWNRTIRDVNLGFKMEDDTESCSAYSKNEDSPFIVFILLREAGRLQCIGSIIDSFHVLTAKTCFDNVNVPSLLVLAGTRSPYYGKNTQVKYVRKIEKHTMNLAIVTLIKPLMFNQHVQPIKIVGPEKSKQSVTAAYSNFEPNMVAGLKLSKVGPVRGDKIPGGFLYKYEEQGKLMNGEDCAEFFVEQKFKNPPKLDEDHNFCVGGQAEFCWTALGSPLVIYMDHIPFQLAITTHTPCRQLPPTPKPDPDEEPEEDPQLESLALVQIRIDWFFKWIKTYSLIDS